MTFKWFLCVYFSLGLLLNLSCDDFNVVVSDPAGSGRTSIQPNAR